MTAILPRAPSAAVSTHAGAGPLSGAGIVLTRPAGTSSTLALRVRKFGGVPVTLPGMALRPAAEPAAARAALRAARPASDWVFLSPAAVRFAFGLLPNLQLRDPSRVFTVGGGTTRALARHGITACAPTTSQDSEGLLALPQMQHMRGRHVALIGAPGGRSLLGDELAQRGARVDRVMIYRREPPRLTRRHFDALERAPEPLVTLLSSAEALTNLVALLPAPLLTRLRHQPLVVCSLRLATLARAQGFLDVAVARSAQPSDLLDGAQGVMARHRL